MRRTYDSTLKATVTLDDAGHVRGLNHLDEYREIENLRGREAAQAYILEIAGPLNIAPETLRNLDQPISYFDPLTQEIEYRFSEEKAAFDAVTYAYYQTYLNLPVWGAGITATIKQAPARAVASTNTSALGIDAAMPSAQAIACYRRLFATAEKADPALSRFVAKQSKASEISGARLLTDILSKATKSAKELTDKQTASRLIRGRFFVYRYEAARRITDHPQPESAPGPNAKEKATTQPGDRPLSGTPPTLPLPPLPKSIRDGEWYVVAELIVHLPFEGRPMNWRILMDVETNSVLYARALISPVNGLIFSADPITLTATPLIPLPPTPRRSTWSAAVPPCQV